MCVISTKLCWAGRNNSLKIYINTVLFPIISSSLKINPGLACYFMSIIPAFRAEAGGSQVLGQPRLDPHMGRYNLKIKLETKKNPSRYIASSNNTISHCFHMC